MIEFVFDVVFCLSLFKQSKIIHNSYYVLQLLF